MPLSVKVGLSIGDFMLDGVGDPASSPLQGHSPHFCPMSLVAKRLDG